LAFLQEATPRGTLTKQKKSTADQRTQPHISLEHGTGANLLGKLKRAAGMARRRPLLLLGIGPGLVVLLVVVLVLSLRHGTPVVEIDEDLGKDIGKAAAPSTGQHYALELDGRTGYVELPFCYDGTHPVTVEATVVPSPRMPNKVFSGVVSCQGPGGLYLGMDEGRWRFLGWNDDMQGCPRAESDEQPKFGAVQHLAGVFDGQSLIIFMNGRRATNPGNFVRTFKGHSPNFLIGATPRFKDRQLFAIDHFGGIVAEVRVSRVVRYTMDFTPQRRLEPDRDTIALYHFDEGEGNVAHDASGNGNHGKLHGSYRFVRASVLDQSRNDSPPPAIAPFDAAKAKEHQAAWARQLGFPVEMTNSIGMKLVLIPPGEFTMGGGGGAHKVTITKAFCLGKYEVTQEEWEAVMGRGNNPSSFKGPKNPVEQVSWEDCQFFLKKLGEKCGAAEGSYRLPTEAQWEYACRAGSTGGFCFGDSEVELDEYGWFDKNSEKKTHPVGEKKPNAWGLFDIHGNVWEWCADWFGQDYYKASPRSDPTGPPSGSIRVNRGGSWGGAAWLCWSAYRDLREPGFRNIFLGFRVSLVLPDTAAQRVQPPAELKSQIPDLKSQITNPESSSPPPAVAPFDANKAKEHQEAWAKHLGVPVELTNSIGMKLVLIPPGEFMMGSPKELIEEELKAHSDDPWYKGHLPGEGPRHRVRITKPFYLGAYEVTQEEYQRVMGNNPSEFSATGQHKDKVTGQDTKRFPVEMVSWDDAVDFCRKLSNLPEEKVAGRTYRLPSEAQWEYACRAGSTGRYSFSSGRSGIPKEYEEHELSEFGWFNGNSDGMSHAVGGKRPSAWGLYDMHGNVWEWCQDWYDKDYYAKSPTDDPGGPPGGSNRVIRGGSWHEPAWFCRSARRSDPVPGYLPYNLDLRVSQVLADK
jgi:formylglycine-generating enzyme required for sulfatase activity